MPPSPATRQYPAPDGVAARPTTGALSASAPDVTVWMPVPGAAAAVDVSHAPATATTAAIRRTRGALCQLPPTGARSAGPVAQMRQPGARPSAGRDQGRRDQGRSTLDGGAWGAVVDGVDVVDRLRGEKVAVALVRGGAVPPRPRL